MPQTDFATKPRVLMGRGKTGGLMVVIDSPTNNEVLVNEVIFGVPRKIVDLTLQACGNTLPVWWTCAVKVSHPADKIIRQAIWQRWIGPLQTEIANVQPKKILCLGPTALACVMMATGPMAITKYHGKGFMHPLGAYVVATYNPFKVFAVAELFRDFSKAVYKLMTRDHPMDPPKMSLLIPETMEELSNALCYLQTHEAISCDLETRPLLPGLEHDKDSFDPYAGKIMSFGFGARLRENEGYAVIIPERTLDHPDAREIIRHFFTSYAGTIAFHNGKFDSKFIEAFIGFDWDVGIIEDTMLMCYVLDERAMSAHSSLGLKTQARIRYDAEDYHMNFTEYYRIFFEGNTVERERIEHDMHLYHSLDLYFGIQLWYDLRAEAMEEAPELYTNLCQKILFPGSKVLSHVEYRGVLLDRDYTFARSEELRIELIESVGQLEEALGDKKFDIFSPAQVRDYINSFGMHTVVRQRGGDAENDNPVGTRKDEMQRLIETAPPELAAVIPIILRIRQAHKLNKTYYLALLERSKLSGRIHPDFRLAGTITGRLSCANPNMQNIPARIGSVVRDCFVATPGYVFVQMDYSQLELRMAALLARDHNMAETFRNGVDIHMVVAMEIFNCPESSVTKNMRMMGKNIDFGILYGRGARTIVEGPEMDKYVQDGGKRWTIDEANGFINRFKAGFPALTKWMADTGTLGIKQQYVESAFNRRRRFPFVPNIPRVISEIRRQSVNAPVQSASSDVCLVAMIKLHEVLPSYARVLFSVHDSILFEIEEDKCDQIIPFIQEVMETAHGLDDFVPFEVTAEKGYSWGTMDKVKLVHHA